jgi:hypothetical protein
MKHTVTRSFNYDVTCQGAIINNLNPPEIAVHLKGGVVNARACATQTQSKQQVLGNKMHFDDVVARACSPSARLFFPCESSVMKITLSRHVSSMLLGRFIKSERAS